MASEEVICDLETMVKKFMAQKGFQDFDLKIEGTSEVGDNYLGEVIFFELTYNNASNKYQMVMKTAKRSEELKKLMPVSLVYEREVFMYSKVFPSYRSFVRNKNSTLNYNFAPDLYWTCTESNKETIILENLKYKGFSLWNRQIPWNLEHSLFVMKKYGEYHAISIAFRIQKPTLFKEWKRNLTNLNAEFSKYFNAEQMYRDPFKVGVDCLTKAGKSDLAKKYEMLFDNFIDCINEATPEEDEIVISHGDCWNNNFMFKYQDEDTSKPIEMRFLDFQLSALDSPVKDLSYNIYSTCDKSVLDNFSSLMETYYSSLCNTLKMLGNDPHQLFTYDQLMEHWRKYGKFGLMLSTVIMKFALLNRDKAPDIVKMSEEGKDVIQVFDVPTDNQEEYNRRMLDIFEHYGETFL